MFHVQAEERAMTNPEHVEVVKQGAEAIRLWREENPNETLDLTIAQLPRAALIGADLHGALLVEANLSGASLSEADLRQANLRQADLSDAVLIRAHLAGAFLTETSLARANLHSVRGAPQAYDLETVRRGEGDAHYFETCHRPWPERWFDWEHLRTVGRLPLFGISYTALILIPIVFAGLAAYNQQIDQLYTWAEQIVALPDSALHEVASLLKRLDRRPIPSLSLVLLVSTALLAIASTLYTWRCPSRIKEITRDVWCDQLGHSLLHYWPLAWKHRYIRLVCAACYALGGAGALWVLCTKVWHTAVFIWEHSTWSWPWR